MCNIEGLGMGHVLWLHMNMHISCKYVFYTMELIREQYLFWIQAWEGELEQAEDVDVDWEE